MQQEYAMYYDRENLKLIFIGEMNYKIVILPSIYTLRKSTVNILEEFLNNGGTVISVGDLPNRIDGKLSDEINKFNKRLIRIKNNPQELDLELSKLYTQRIKINSLNNLPTETIWLQE